MIKTFYTLVLTVALALPVVGNASVRVGEVAPDFTLVNSNGEQFNLMSKRGKTVVLFWMGYS